MKPTILRHILLISALIYIFAASSPLATAQRHITPTSPPPGVNHNKDGNPKFDRSRLKETVDAQGVVVLVDTVTGEEVVDSTAMIRVKPNLYPLLHSVTIGVNLWDGITRILGQDYGLVGFRGELSLHNRYKPYVEIGLSKASFSPDGNNYTFDSPVSPYFKIGAGYNIFYNSDPAYQLCFNLGFGLTSFNYTYKNIVVSDGYWPEVGPFDFPRQRSTTCFLEVGAGIKVKLIGPLSGGWNVAYHSRLHSSKAPYGEPVIIPGYGKRDGSLAVSVFLMYTIPLGKKTVPDSEKSQK